MGDYTVRLEYRPGDKNDHLAEVIRRLDEKCFPDKDVHREPFGTTWWWIARDKTNGSPVGYAGLRYLTKPDDCAYFCRAGVIASHRGQGLQKRLIRARVAYARRQGWSGVLTYTSADNYPSANSLVSQGFRLYSPSFAWSGREMLYFRLLF